MSQNLIAHQAEEIRNLPDEILVNAFQSAIQFRLLVLSSSFPDNSYVTPDALRFAPCAGGVQ